MIKVKAKDGEVVLTLVDSWRVRVDVLSPADARALARRISYVVRELQAKVVCSQCRNCGRGDVDGCPECGRHRRLQADGSYQVTGPTRGQGSE